MFEYFKWFFLLLAIKCNNCHCILVLYSFVHIDQTYAKLLVISLIIHFVTAPVEFAYAKGSVHSMVTDLIARLGNYKKCGAVCCLWSPLGECQQFLCKSIYSLKWNCHGQAFRSILAVVILMAIPTASVTSSH